MANLIENEDAIREQARLFDDVRPAGAKLFLLKHAPDKSSFVVICEITSGWLAGNNKQREQTCFRFATSDPNFDNYFAAHSHIGYGVPTDDEIDVYLISPDARDRLTPNSLHPIYKCYGARITEERFAIPE